MKNPKRRTPSKGNNISVGKYFLWDEGSWRDSCTGGTYWVEM